MPREGLRKAYDACITCKVHSAYARLAHPLECRSVRDAFGTASSMYVLCV